jgi:hypothetical protein
MARWAIDSQVAAAARRQKEVARGVRPAYWERRAPVGPPVPQARPAMTTWTRARLVERRCCIGHSGVVFATNGRGVCEQPEEAQVRAPGREEAVR